MKKIILHLLFLLFVVSSTAQNVYPLFTVSDLEINVPAQLPGIKTDIVTNGMISYKIKGQIFTEGQNNSIQETTAGFNGKSSRLTPYETLTELVAVVRQSNWKALKKLYVKNSAKELDNLIPADKRAAYFASLNENKLVKIVAGFEYKNGFMVFIENPDKSVNSAFFVKDGKKYMMQRLVDSSAMLWNLALYFRFKPQPMVKANLLQKQDSVAFSSEQKLVFTVAPGNWILLYKNQLGGPVIIRVQDGDAENDFDPEAGKIEVRIGQNTLSGRKRYEILATESNYPVYMVSDNLLDNATKIVFSVY